MLSRKFSLKINFTLKVFSGSILLRKIAKGINITLQLHNVYEELMQIWSYPFLIITDVKVVFKFMHALI